MGSEMCIRDSKRDIHSVQEQQQEQEQEERTAKRRKKSSFEEYKSKRKSSESSKEGEVKLFVHHLLWVPDHHH